jgi:ABC-type glycerol-3-phosphate transport system permease component
MKKNLCTILLLFSAIFVFAQNPYKQNLVDLATITFPQKPETLDTLGHNTAQFIDSTAIYSAVTRELDSDRLLQIHSDKLSEFYDGNIQGFLDAAQGKLIIKKTFEMDGLKGVEIEFITTANPNLPDLRFARFILVNNTLITVYFMTSSENRQATQTARTQFLNSLTITADKTSLTQGVDHPAAYAIGSVIGKLVAWAVILGVIAGVVLLIRRITTKKKTLDKAEF